MLKLIVEGHGEVKALPVLMRRLAWECFKVSDPPLINRPGRYSANRLINISNGQLCGIGEDIQKASRHARNEGATCILILLDLDDHCPKQAYELIYPQIKTKTSFDQNALVFAKCEFEAWFLASAETLVNGASIYQPDPEAKRNCKKTLEKHLQLKFPYSETADQVKYVSRININTVYRRCRSFRKLVSDYYEILRFMGCNPTEWNP